MAEQIIRRELADWVEPSLLHAALWAQHDNVIWLDAGPAAQEGYSYLGVGSGAIIRGNDLDILRSRIPAPKASGYRGGPFQLGYVGWLGYELGSLTTGVELASGAQSPVSFVEVRAAFEFDHSRQRVTLLAHSEHDAVALTTVLTDTNERPKPAAGAVNSAAVQARHADERYLQMVQSCREAIKRGDAYQLCLTNELFVDGTWDALAVYTRLRHDNPSHHGAMLSIGGVHLLSSSPEVFLRLTGDGRLSTMPIKGTRARGENPEADERLVRELLESHKEQAENVMIVDLMRNDLSKVGMLGTVAAKDLLQVQTLPHVHQLVSTVSTQLRPGLSAIDAIEATFPAGSMTGAPKIAAMRILGGLEAGPRGIYSGAFGWLGYDGACELAMVIRSIVIDDTGASIGTGGGITIDSDPQAELDEMKLKAEPALRALGLA